MPFESDHGPRRVVAAIGLGSNVGDRVGHLEYAFSSLAAMPGTRLLARSSVIETAPLVLPEQPGGGSVADAGGPYLNAAALVETALSAHGLLDNLLQIERMRGRERTAGRRWEARTLDLDILLYGDRIINEPGLVVPHPRLHERLFALGPLSEIAPGMLIPTRGATVSELLAGLQGAAPPGTKSDGG